MIIRQTHSGSPVIIKNNGMQKTSEQNDKTIDLSETMIIQNTFQK